MGGENSTGFNQAQALFQTAKGRRTIAKDIVVTAVSDTVNAIISAEKNKVGQAILKFVTDNPNENLWKVIRVKVTQEFNKKTGQVEQRVIKDYRRLAQDPNVFITWVEGKAHAIQFRDGPNSSLARAIKSMNTASVPEFLQAIGQLTRWYAYVNTALSPAFLLRNPARDIQTALAKAFADYDASVSGKIITNLPRAIKAARMGLGNRKKFDEFAKKEPELAKFIREYLESGSKTDYYRTKPIEKMKASLEKELQAARGGVLGAPERVAREVGKQVEFVNAVLENATRVSMFITLREAGYSRHQSAVAAKNLTVNFNRKGEQTTWWNSLYAFWNPAVQGLHLTVKLLSNPKIQKLMVALGGAVIGLVQYNILMGGEDDDGEPNYFRVANHAKERNLIIMWPDGSGRFTKFPLPYGLNVPINAAQAIPHVLYGQPPLEQAAWVAGSAWNSFSPVSEHGVNTIIPTVADPFVDIGANRNFAGWKIMPDKNPYEDVPTPDSRRAFRSVNPLAKWLAETLNDTTGGNENKPGYIDISPESIEHMVGTYAGAPGGFAKRVLQWFSDPEMDTSRKPLVRVFHGKVSPWVIGDRYRDNKEHILYLRERADFLKDKSGDSPEDKAIYNSFRDDNKEGLALHNNLKSAERRLRKYYARRRDLLAEPEEDEAKIKRVESDIEKEKAKINKKYNETFMP